MKFNHLLVAAATSAALLSTNVMAADAGTITFTGCLTETTCDVDIGGSGADATVALPPTSVTNLATAGAISARTQFTMELSGCTGGTANTAKAYFQAGSTVDTSTGRLKNTDVSATGATNVSLQLRDGQDSSIIFPGDSAQIASAGYVDITSGMASLPYFVEYFAEGPTTSGAVASQVTYNLTYQ